MNKVTERRMEPNYEVECNGGVDNKGCMFAHEAIIVNPNWGLVYDGRPR